MKSLMFCGILIFCSIIACSFEKKGENINNFEPFGLKFPENSTIRIEGDVLTFSLPEGYFLYGYDQNNQFHKAEAGIQVGVTCTCNSGNGGCSPVDYKGDYGCAMTTCTTCTKSKASFTGSSGLVELIDYIIIREEYSGWVRKIEELQEELVYNSKFVNSPLIKEAIDEYSNHLMESENPDEKIIIPMLIMGNIVFIEIPEDIDNVSLRVQGGAVGFKCTCNSGGKCPKKGMLGIATYCDATDCKSCTLTKATIVNSNGKTQEFSVVNGYVVY